MSKNGGKSRLDEGQSVCLLHGHSAGDGESVKINLFLSEEWSDMSAEG